MDPQGSHSICTLYRRLETRQGTEGFLGHETCQGQTSSVERGVKENRVHLRLQNLGGASQTATRKELSKGVEGRSIAS